MTPTDPAPRHDRAYCGANRRQREGTCQRPAGWGTPHPGFGPCKLHGGSTRNHVAAGQRAMAERAVKTYGLPLDIAPAEALLEEVRWTAGHVAWLRERVQEVEQQALVWGMTQRVDQGATEFPGVNTTEGAVPNVWLDLYQRERKHLIEVCKVTLAAGIEERRIQMAQQQGAEMAGVFRRVLAALGLTAEQSAMVPGLLAREVGAITGAPKVIEGRT